MVCSEGKLIVDGDLRGQAALSDFQFCVTSSVRLTRTPVILWRVNIQISCGRLSIGLLGLMQKLRQAD